MAIRAENGAEAVPGTGNEPAWPAFEKPEPPASAVAGALDVYAASAGGAVVWPGVTAPAELLTHVADWLRGYGNRGTRRTYAESLGLPVSETDLAEWLHTATRGTEWAAALGSYAAAMGLDGRGGGEGPSSTRPPAPARGKLRPLHWFRWCASRGIDPIAARSTDVKAWLEALDDAGAAVATRDRMLGTLKALYGSLADAEITPGNPAALNRRGWASPPPDARPARSR